MTTEPQATLIYQLNGIKVTLLHGMYTVSDGKVSVTTDKIDCFKYEALKCLLQKKVSVKSFVKAAASKVKSFTPGYFKKFSWGNTGGGVMGKDFENYIRREAELREFAEMGY